jgi:ribosomal protein L37AE/L43A
MQQQEAGYHAECSASGCPNTFRIPHQGRWLYNKWYCLKCADVLEGGMKNGVTVAKQLLIEHLVPAHEIMDG